VDAFTPQQSHAFLCVPPTAPAGPHVISAWRPHRIYVAAEKNNGRSPHTLSAPAAPAVGGPRSFSVIGHCRCRQRVDEKRAKQMAASAAGQ